MLMNMPSLEKLAHEIGAILDKPLPRPGQKITVRSVEDPVGKTSMLLNVYGEIKTEQDTSFLSGTSGILLALLAPYKSIHFSYEHLLIP